MTKEDLIKSAEVFAGFGAEAVREYSEKTDYLVLVVQNRISGINNIQTITNSNAGMLASNTANHARFISAILHDFNAEIFVDTVIWVFRTYISHGFKLEFWHVFLNLWIEVLSEVLAFESRKEIIPLYKWMIAHIDDFAELARETVTS